MRLFFINILIKYLFKPISPNNVMFMTKYKTIYPYLFSWVTRPKGVKQQILAVLGYFWCSDMRQLLWIPMGFEDFGAIFGEAKPDWTNESCRFLFHIGAIDSSHLRIHVTDFHSRTWEAVRSVEQLEDMVIPLFCDIFLIVCLFICSSH